MSRNKLMAMAGAAALMAFLPAVSVAQSNTPQQSLREMVEQAPASDWITINPDNLVVMDLPSGPMIIAMQPELAPNHIERVRTLTSQGFYNGTIFHRVIDGFMAQGGDPTGTGTGGSELPDIAGEFAQDAAHVSNVAIIGRDDRAAQIGFVGVVPVGTQPPTLPKFLNNDVYALWGLHCQGVMSMARAQSPNSANSQFFIMYGDRRGSLDQGYTVWGKVVSGFQHAKRISRGEPPVRPTPIVRMRMMRQLPAAEQQTVEYLNPASDTFEKYLTTSLRVTSNGYVREACGIDVPIRINGELTE
ncbi:peptidylprolyl isomerase [Parvularcula marina]|uniref:peptidylprolyl isomerase n=2 Tax=Parvularcula marina TaxID=2292771 RepID=UPI003515912E